MRLSTPLLTLVVNFLLGASWAVTFLGALILSYIFLHIGVIYSLFGFFIGAIPGLLFVLLIEFFFIHHEKLEELKKQTKLLEDLGNKL